MIKIKELPLGCIIWFHDDILGVTGVTLPGKYYDMNCKPISGNDSDYELVEE